MIPQNLCDGVLKYVCTNAALGSGVETAVPGFYAIANAEKTDCSASFYEPILCLVLQGAKEAYIGGRNVRYGAGDALIVSHAVPVDAAIIRASTNQPYISLALQLDLSLARSLYDEIGEFPDDDEDLHSMDASASDSALLDAVGRLFWLSQDKAEAKALAPLVKKEIHFRLLRAKHGAMLRQLLRHESPASKISKAISHIRSNYSDTIAVSSLASVSGMSVSAFHEHFKSVTSTTPLQYQKDLRLLEARRLLLGGGRSVAQAAYAVGYESPTQFSREYSRKFGLSPRDQKAGAV